ncbi:MAG: MlaA family lipoprotein [Burkholderiaceae bacterium]
MTGARHWFATARMTCALVCLAVLSGCASLPAGHQTDARDPWERYNRAMFEFNTQVDEAVIKPVAEGYKEYVPEPIRTAFGNFFSNLGDIVNTLHHLLQGEPSKAGNAASRVVINTTVGVLGLGDPAGSMGYAKTNEDFGQTFGRWGSEPGPYFVIPLLGPSTVRDTVGRVADFAVDPFDQIFSVGTSTEWTVRGTRIVDARAGFLDMESTLDALSFDRYLSVRDAYLARRAQQVNDGRTPAPHQPAPKASVDGAAGDPAALQFSKRW